MAFVNIPKDITKIEPQFMLGLTKRQVKGFVTGAVLGLITFITTRISFGNTIGLILLMIVAIPCIIYGIYEPIGLTIEEFIKAFIYFTFVSKGVRTYKTVNYYNHLKKSYEEEAKNIERENKSNQRTTRKNKKRKY